MNVENNSEVGRVGKTPKYNLKASLEETIRAHALLTLLPPPHCHIILCIQSHRQKKFPRAREVQRANCVFMSALRE